MNAKLKQYKILIHASGDETLIAARNSLISMTWEAGHYARTLTTTLDQPRNENIDESIAAADLFVALCQKPGPETLAACDSAATHRKPVLAFLLTSPGSGTADDHLSEGTAPLQSSVYRSPNGSVTRIGDPTTLSSEYLLRLDRLIRELDKAKNPEKPGAHEAISNPFVASFVHMAEQWHVLNERCNRNADLKRSVSAFVLELYFARLVRGGMTRWFLESGSSIAYLAESITINWPWLCSKLDEVETNNILAYLQLVSVDSLSRFSLYPPGRPEGKYGATFGAIRLLTPPVRHGSSIGHPIEGKARFETDQIKSHFADYYGQSGIIFGATSGIELNPASPFQGFHVGSYPNMLIKRAYLEASLEQGLPVVIVTTESKVSAPFEADKCFPICDVDFTWEMVCREVPLAIACAFREADAKDKAVGRLRDIGFVHEEADRKGQNPYPVIVSNDRFWELRKTWVKSEREVESEEGLRQNDGEVLGTTRPM